LLHLSKNVQEQLESAGGRIEYLNHSSAYSTINLTFYQILNGGAVNEKMLSYCQQMKIAFTDRLKWVGGLLLILISLWPLYNAPYLVW